MKKEKEILKNIVFSDDDMSNDNENNDNKNEESLNDNDDNNKIYLPPAINDININGLGKRVVVFFGPRGVGKTVALIRLSMYLQSLNKHSVEINSNFRDDEYYKEVVIPSFKMNREAMKTGLAPKRTSKNDFILIDINKNRSTYAQLLEAPGEHYYNLDTNIQDYSYLNDIYADTNVKRRLTIFFFEPQMRQKLVNMPNGEQAYQKYIDEIKYILQEYLTNKKKDKVMFIYNKANHLFDNTGKSSLNDNAFIKKLKDEFNKGDNNIINYFGERRTLFKPFASGTFSKNTKERKLRYKNKKGNMVEEEEIRDLFKAGSPIYPQRFWADIKSKI